MGVLLRLSPDDDEVYRGSSIPKRGNHVSIRVKTTGKLVFIEKSTSDVITFHPDQLDHVQEALDAAKKQRDAVKAQAR